MHVGEVIRRIRKDKRMTLMELSEKSGVALATLSRIENSKMTGTLQSHMDICKALEISLPELYKDLGTAKKTVDVMMKKERADVFLHDKKATSEMLTSSVLNKKMMPMLTKIAKGGVTHKEENKQGVEKFIYVLSGKVEANIGASRYDLTKGDSLYFESSLPHYFKNAGADEALLVSVTCPPAM